MRSFAISNPIESQALAYDLWLPSFICPSPFPLQSCFLLCSPQMDPNRTSQFWFKAIGQCILKQRTTPLGSPSEFLMTIRLSFLILLIILICPNGYTTFFYDQLAGKLCFPLLEFFRKVFSYLQFPLNQLTPNSFRLLCGVAIVYCSTHSFTPSCLPLFFRLEQEWSYGLLFH